MKSFSILRPLFSLTFSSCVFLLIARFLGQSLLAQPLDLTSRATKPTVIYEVKSRTTAVLKSGSGKKLIMEMVKPPVFPAPPPAIKLPPIDPALREARREAWAIESKKERRILSLSGISYPNGQTFLSWFTRGPDGQWQTYEAWSLTDFRSAWMVQEFEVGNTIYHIFPSVHPASRGEQRRPMPGPLYFPEGHPGFRLVKGNPLHTQSLEAIVALHQIYREEGPILTAQWLKQQALAQAEAAHLKANPPPVRDLTVRYWPGAHVRLQPFIMYKTGYRRRQ